MRTSDLLLVTGATMRLTRVIVSDDIGQWWIKDPLDAWMHGHSARDAAPTLPEVCSCAGAFVTSKGVHYCPRHGETPPASPRDRMRFHKYLSGLECPACVGFWVGAGVLTTYALSKRNRRALAAWRFIAGALALNVVVTETGKQIDYWG